MNKDVLPSEDYWTAIGFTPSEVVKHIDGPNVRRGLEGWSSDDFERTLQYAGEGHIGVGVSRSILPGLVQRNAPKTARLLTLLSRFVEETRSFGVHRVAREAGIDPVGMGRKGLVLALFLKDPDLLTDASFRALQGGLQTVHTFVTSEGVSKGRLTSIRFRGIFESKLRNAPSLMGKQVRLERMSTQRGNEEVSFYVKHEDRKQRMDLMDSYHWDTPAKWTIVTYHTKGGGLEVRTRRKKVLDDVVRVAGEATFGRADAFAPLPLTAHPTGRSTVQEVSYGIELVNQLLVGLESACTTLKGSPTVRVSSVDVFPTVEELKKFKDIDLTVDPSGWQVRLTYKRNGVTKEVTVSKPGPSSELRFHPPVPFEVRSWVSQLVLKGGVPSLP